MPQLGIPPVTTKTQCSQINIKNKKLLVSPTDGGSGSGWGTHFFFFVLFRNSLAFNVNDRLDQKSKNTASRKSSLKYSWCSAFFTVQLSHPYMTTGKTIALTRRTFVGKVMFKILQARLQQYMNCELSDVQAGFRRGRRTRDQIANIC